MTAPPTVLVTGIGGNVGQGILRNLRTSESPLRIIGTDTGDFPAGSYYCNQAHKVPFASDPTYLDCVGSLCHQEGVSLIIPSTDLETAVLSKWANGNLNGCTVLASPPSTCALSLDKWLTAQACKASALPFADTYLPSTRPTNGHGMIAKPRQGRGSRGIILDPPSPGSLPDTDYILQPLYQGIEITTAAYITKRGQLHSQITMKRDLEAGMTLRCEVVSDYDDAISATCQSYARHLGFLGPFNLQSIVTASGQIFPFEINCRYSGTNSIRAQFGFTDVTWGLQEYLFDKTPSPAPATYSGAAVRLMLDIVYPGKSLLEAREDPSSGQLF
jgi:carbamoyl-phosphate synthase large subunit